MTLRYPVAPLHWTDRATPPAALQYPCNAVRTLGVPTHNAGYIDNPIFCVMRNYRDNCSLAVITRFQLLEGEKQQWPQTTISSGNVLYFRRVWFLIPHLSCIIITDLLIITHYILWHFNMPYYNFEKLFDEFNLVFLHSGSIPLVWIINCNKNCPEMGSFKQLSRAYFCRSTGQAAYHPSIDIMLIYVV